jgi:hypothetical protein
MRLTWRPSWSQSLRKAVPISINKYLNFSLKHINLFFYLRNWTSWQKRVETNAYVVFKHLKKKQLGYALVLEIGGLTYPLPLAPSFSSLL